MHLFWQHCAMATVQRTLVHVIGNHIKCHLICIKCRYSFIAIATALCVCECQSFDTKQAQFHTENI